MIIIHFLTVLVIAHLFFRKYFDHVFFLGIIVIIANYVIWQGIKTFLTKEIEITHSADGLVFKHPVILTGLIAQIYGATEIISGIIAIIYFIGPLITNGN